MDVRRGPDGFEVLTEWKCFASFDPKWEIFGNIYREAPEKVKQFLESSRQTKKFKAKIRKTIRNDIYCTRAKLKVAFDFGSPSSNQGSIGADIAGVESIAGVNRSRDINIGECYKALGLREVEGSFKTGLSAWAEQSQAYSSGSTINRMSTGVASECGLNKINRNIPADEFGRWKKEVNAKIQHLEERIPQHHIRSLAVNDFYKIALIMEEIALYIGWLRKERVARVGVRYLISDLPHTEILFKEKEVGSH
eukprot:snap_masked-scaffold_13-processed-gene-9.40-mRNA-1 protein AED:1.00 eAED:1.00 QI:0/0/0/0/1/1/3/0/250